MRRKERVVTCQAGFDRHPAVPGHQTGSAGCFPALLLLLAECFFKVLRQDYNTNSVQNATATPNVDMSENYLQGPCCIQIPRLADLVPALPAEEPVGLPGKHEIHIIFRFESPHYSTQRDQIYKIGVPGSHLALPPILRHDKHKISPMQYNPWNWGT